jgi:hypothetical protein
MRRDYRHFFSRSRAPAWECVSFGLLPENSLEQYRKIIRGSRNQAPDNRSESALAILIGQYADPMVLARGPTRFQASHPSLSFISA